MDKKSRREWYRAWVAVGLREGLKYRDLSARSGLSARTLHRWTRVFREEALRGAPPDDDHQTFVQLVERVQGGPTRIEVYVPGEPRLVIDGAAIVRFLVGALRSIKAET